VGAGERNDGGYFDMDYDYALNPGIASDFWVVYETLTFLGSTGAADAPGEIASDQSLVGTG
jgi:hypothetical protein